MILRHARLLAVCSASLLSSVCFAQSVSARAENAYLLTSALEPSIVNTRLTGGIVNTRVGGAEDVGPSSVGARGEVFMTPAAPASRFPARPARTLPTLEGLGKASTKPRELPPPAEQPKPSQPVIGAP